MSIQEARRRLTVLRWADAEFQDPYFAEAVQKIAVEPALARWWADQWALDELLASRLRELSTPASKG